MRLKMWSLESDTLSSAPNYARIGCDLAGLLHPLGPPSPQLSGRQLHPLHRMLEKEAVVVTVTGAAWLLEERTHRQLSGLPENGKWACIETKQAAAGKAPPLRKASN